MSVNVSAGQRGGDEGNRTPNPRLAKRDEPYQVLPANAVLCVLVLVTHCPTAPVVNERQRFCRFFADFANTGAGSTVSGGPAVLMIYDRATNLRTTSKPALVWGLRSGVAVVVVLRQVCATIGPRADCAATRAGHVRDGSAARRWRSSRRGANLGDLPPGEGMLFCPRPAG